MTRSAPAPRRPFGGPAPAYVREVSELYDAIGSLFRERVSTGVFVTRDEYRRGFRAIPKLVAALGIAPDIDVYDDFQLSVAFFAAASAAGLLWVDGVRVLPPETFGKAVAR